MHESIDANNQKLISSVEHLPRPQDLPDLPQEHPLAEAWKTYKREIGRLLAESHNGRYVLIKADQVVGIWDTHLDAYQAGRQHFGIEVFLVQEIRAVERQVCLGYYHRCHCSSLSR